MVFIGAYIYRQLSRFATIHAFDAKLASVNENVQITCTEPKFKPKTKPRGLILPARAAHYRPTRLTTFINISMLMLMNGG